MWLEHRSEGEKEGQKKKETKNKCDQQATVTNLVNINPNNHFKFRLSQYTNQKTKMESVLK